jgi:hypothetical protein
VRQAASPLSQRLHESTETLYQEHPERFANGQLRTLQRKVKHWRATEGLAQEVYFVQEHRAGELCESDFTHLTELGVSISGEEFPHLLYHFVLTYSNWEMGTICYSESFATGGLGRSTGAQCANDRLERERY